MIQSSWPKPPMLSASMSIRLPRAIVLCVDGKPSIQALERAQGYLKLPNGRAGKHPKVRFHFIPTRSSWLNQIETWFSILQGQSLNGRFLHHHRAFAGAPRGFHRSIQRDRRAIRMDQEKRFASGGSKIAVSLNSDSERWRRVTAGRLRDQRPNLDRSGQGGVARTRELCFDPGAPAGRRASGSRPIRAVGRLRGETASCSIGIFGLRRRELGSSL